MIHTVPSRPGGIGAVVVGAAGDVAAPNSTGAFWIDGVAFRAEG